MKTKFKFQRLRHRTIKYSTHRVPTSCLCNAYI